MLIFCLKKPPGAASILIGLRFHQNIPERTVAVNVSEPGRHGSHAGLLAVI